MSIDKVLVVDDEQIMRHFLSETIRRQQIEVVEAPDGYEALEILKKSSFDLVITDMKMPGLSGIDLLRHIKEVAPATFVVVITGFGTIETAVEAMKLGALNYLIKPFTPETIETLIEKAREQQALIAENHYFRQEVRSRHGDTLGLTSSKQESAIRVVGESAALKRILDDVMRVAKSNANIFIHGESGTGKEVIAHAIHYNSLRHNQPFIKVNCAAIPETLIESEFFGHEKGAFTGANAKRCGRFELAHQGTLLLDEVTEIPLVLQAKLLRVIQEHEFERVGGSKPIKADARLISTSNRDMKAALKQKTLREDLYYRLNVVPIYLPPLRERREDILPLAEYFLKKLCLENYKNPEEKMFTPESKKLLYGYGWPGNVRELANVIERAIVLESGSLIAPEHLRMDISVEEKASLERPFPQGTITLPIGTSLEELEKKMILETWQAHHQAPTKAAELLGISLRKLRSKLAAYKIEA